MNFMSTIRSRGIMKAIVSVLAAIAFCTTQASHAQSAPPQKLTAIQVTQREAAVFDALDLSRPELAAVAAAWKQHDTPAAEKAFAAYLRARDSVKWGPEPESGDRGLRVEHDKTIADWAVEGKLQGGQTPYFYTFPNGDVDWHYNATHSMPGVAPDNEWQWQLNRMPAWGPLARTYRDTHDERYAQAFDREINSWIAQCPVADHVDNVPGSVWRTMRRASAWAARGRLRSLPFAIRPRSAMPTWLCLSVHFSITETTCATTTPDSTFSLWR